MNVAKPRRCSNVLLPFLGLITVHFAGCAYELDDTPHDPNLINSLQFKVGPNPEITSPTPGSTFSATSVTFSWTENSTSVQSWALYVGNSLGSADIYHGGIINAATTSQVASGLPGDGRTIYVRLWYRVTGNWSLIDYQYVAGTLDVTTDTRTFISAPAIGSTLAGATITFQWNANGNTVSDWWLYVGDNVSLNGISNLHTSGSFLSSDTLSTAISNIPTDGRRIYARLYARIASVFEIQDFQFVASGTPLSLPMLTTPTHGSTLNSVQFAWTANGHSVDQWTLMIGSTRGRNDLFGKTFGSGTTSTTVPALPKDGRTLYIRLFYRISGTLYFVDSTVKAGSIEAPITNHTSGASLAGPIQFFQWAEPSTAVTDYLLWVLQGSKIVYMGNSLGTTRQTTATGLPSDSTTITVRVWFKIGTTWSFTDSSFISAPTNGCSDGTREWFVTTSTHPNIAGCSGGWSIPGVLTSSSSCSRISGNHSANTTGSGCAPDDLCAAGWHICATPTEVSNNSSTGCDNGTGTPTTGFYSTRQSGPGTGLCGTGANDLFGCGDVGYALPGGGYGGGCGPFNRFSHNLCSYFTTDWQCGSNGEQEANNATKISSNAGGVLCCKD